jgi:ubiquinone/menaquinone biosynthesis C-methylase UbiE
MIHSQLDVYSQTSQLAAERLKADKQRTYELMHVQLGDCVLDVGCGSGTDTIALAQIVGPTGRVIGIDQDAGRIAEANQRAAKAGVSAWVHHYQGDALSLPFKPGAFAVCRSERLLQHLRNPAAALTEMLRVTRAGGWIVVLETDWGTLSVDTEESEIERRVACFEAECMRQNGYAGRQVYRLFKRQGLVEIVLEMRPDYTMHYTLMKQTLQLEECESRMLRAGLVNVEELQRWQRSLAQAEAEGVFFCSLTMTLIAGHKP